MQCRYSAAYLTFPIMEFLLSFEPSVRYPLFNVHCHPPHQHLFIKHKDTQEHTRSNEKTLDYRRTLDYSQEQVEEKKQNKVEKMS